MKKKFFLASLLVGIIVLSGCNCGESNISSTHTSLTTTTPVTSVVDPSTSEGTSTTPTPTTSTLTPSTSEAEPSTTTSIPEPTTSVVSPSTPSGDSIPSLSVPSSVRTYYVGESFYYLNDVTAIDEIDGNITHLIQTTLPTGVEEHLGYVTFISEGTFTFTYSITNSFNRTSTASLDVLVREIADTDVVAPLMTGADDIEILVNEELDLLAGVKVLDDRDGDITSKIELTIDLNATTIRDNVISFSQVGEYYVTYKVSDNGGNIATITRKITVVLEHYIDPESLDRAKFDFVDCNGTKKAETEIVYGDSRESLKISPGKSGVFNKYTLFYISMTDEKINYLENYVNIYFECYVYLTDVHESFSAVLYDGASEKTGGDSGRATAELQPTSEENWYFISVPLSIYKEKGTITESSVYDTMRISNNDPINGFIVLDECKLVYKEGTEVEENPLELADRAKEKYASGATFTSETTIVYGSSTESLKATPTSSKDVITANTTLFFKMSDTPINYLANYNDLSFSVYVYFPEEISAIGFQFALYSGTSTKVSTKYYKIAADELTNIQDTLWYSITIPLSEFYLDTIADTAEFDTLRIQPTSDISLFYFDELKINGTVTEDGNTGGESGGETGGNTGSETTSVTTEDLAQSSLVRRIGDGNTNYDNGDLTATTEQYSSSDGTNVWGSSTSSLNINLSWSSWNTNRDCADMYINLFEQPISFNSITSLGFYVKADGVGSNGLYKVVLSFYQDYNSSSNKVSSEYPSVYVGSNSKVTDTDGETWYYVSFDVPTYISENSISSSATLGSARIRFDTKYAPINIYMDEFIITYNSTSSSTPSSPTHEDVTSSLENLDRARTANARSSGTFSDETTLVYGNSTTSLKVSGQVAQYASSIIKLSDELLSFSASSTNNAYLCGYLYNPYEVELVLSFANGTSKINSENSSLTFYDTGIDGWKYFELKLSSVDSSSNTTDDFDSVRFKANSTGGLAIEQYYVLDALMLVNGVTSSTSSVNNALVTNSMVINKY